MAIRPEKVVLHLSFPHPVYGTFTPIKLEDHQFIDTQEEKDEALDIAKKRLEGWYKANYPPLDMGTNHTEQPVIKEEKAAPESRIAAFIADIYSTKELKVLESYRLMVKKDPALQAAYDQQYEKLSQ